MNKEQSRAQSSSAHEGQGGRAYVRSQKGKHWGQERFAYMCSEFKCQTAWFPGAKLLDHLVCIDGRVTVRM